MSVLLRVPNLTLWPSLNIQFYTLSLGSLNCSKYGISRRINFSVFFRKCFSSQAKLKPEFIDKKIHCCNVDSHRELLQTLHKWEECLCRERKKILNHKLKHEKENKKRKKTASKTFMDDLAQAEEIRNKKKSLPAILKNDLAKIKKVGHETLHTSFRKQEFQAYVEACINSDMISMAQEALHHYHYYYLSKLSKLSMMPVNETTLTSLMHAFAKKKCFKGIKNLFQIMRSLSLKPNMQAFTSSLECLGRQEPFNEVLALKIFMQIKKNNLNLRNILKECKFKTDEKEKIFKVIKKIQPSFKAKPRKVSALYGIPLLNKLHKKNELLVEPSFKGALNKIELLNAMHEQLKHEEIGIVTIKSVFKRPPVSPAVKIKLKQLEEHWREMILAAFTKNVDNIKNTVKKGISLYPFLKVLPPEVYVDLMIQEILSLMQVSETFSPTVQYLHHSLGIRIMNAYFIHQKINSKFVDQLKNFYNKYLNFYLHSEQKSKCYRIYWHSLWLSDLKGPDLESEFVIWPYSVTVKIGQFLYNILLNNITFDANILKRENSKKKFIPVLFIVYRYRGCKSQEEIKPHPILVTLLDYMKEEEIKLNTNLLPMLAPPLPWTSVNSGGFLLSLPIFVRYPDSSTRQQLVLQNMYQSKLNPIFDSLNYLSACPWIINKPILDILISMFNDKGNMALDVIPPRSEWPVCSKISLDMNISKEERIKLYKNRNQLKQHNQDLYSLWCSQNFMLSIANAYRDKVFWFPHNMDFRSRVYPVPPYFNHLGSDVARSILLFAEGRQLGEKGFDWLKLHLVNLSGLKKRGSLDERLQFANEIMPDILDSAQNPLTGKKWWMNSDKPWQTLACCMEIEKVLNSGGPSSYICHFPVHQDGSCNGLQHYAALGRDQEGAEQVNLHPSGQPQDVYSGIASLVERERIKDEAKGDKIALALNGFISRKVVKQTIMTSVYGVTSYGARLQILRQLRDIPEFSQENASRSAWYLATKTFCSLQEMFIATKQIQDWFVDCAEIISHFCGQPVEWITPLHFPIVQPYCKNSSKRQISKNIKLTFSRRIIIVKKPNVKKQKNAFPPNYIHSLDATHMMLTSLFCQRENITFVSVHDCYWTHPSTVNIMNRVCREQFVALHSGQLLEDLSQYFLQKFGYQDSEIKDDNTVLNILKKHINKVLKSVPAKGTFDLKNVLKSTYFFS